MHVNCQLKATTFPGSSDVLINYNKEKFDIIFIDGIHTEQQTLKDIQNASNCISKEGLIIIHDCMPPDAWHQRDQEDFKEGENWNGAVWKAVLRIFNCATGKCTLLDTDWGCGIIDMANNQVPLCKPIPEKIQYEVHYQWLLEYRKSVSAYMRDQVKVFYHLACMGNWKEVFEEQMQQLQKSGFHQINLTILGNEENLNYSKWICSKADLQAYVLFNTPDLAYFEKPALLAIEAHCRQTDGHVLYLHSKGVSSPADETKIKWRRLMMKELVENWHACIEKLPHYDIIGVNWRDMPPTSHFCGNFWYASTTYLRSLADFKIYYNNPRYRIWDRIDDKRLGCEFWISSANNAPRVLSLGYSNVDFCNQQFWRDK